MDETHFSTLLPWRLLKMHIPSPDRRYTAEIKWNRASGWDRGRERALSLYYCRCQYRVSVHLYLLLWCRLWIRIQFIILCLPVIVQRLRLCTYLVRCCYYIIVLCDYYIIVLYALSFSVAEPEEHRKNRHDHGATTII